MISKIKNTREIRIIRLINMLKQTNYFLLIFIAAVSFSQIKCSVDAGTETSIDLEDLALTDDDNVSVDIFSPEDELQPISEPLTGEDCFDALSILDFITPPSTPDENEPFINVPAILRENIYIKTTGPVTRRSLLDEPILRPYIFNNFCWTASFQPFYNYSPRVYFTETSPFLESYIDLKNENIIKEINDALEKNDFNGDIDIPGVLGLFRDMKLQQHRAGVMFSLLYRYNALTFMYRIPLYYIIEHFFMTPREKERVEKSSFFADDNAAVGASPQEEFDRFTFGHLVSDKFGLGDSRLNLLYNVYNSKCSQVWATAFITLPSALPFGAGVLGRDWDGDLPPARYNIKRLFNLYLCPPDKPGASREASRVIQEETIEFLVGALDRLSANLTNSPLGNGGHFGFGPQIEFRQQLSSYISMYGFLQLEWFNISTENRFFLIRKNQQEFNRNWRDPEHSEENLTFLNNQLIATLYTEPICTVIRPGMITNFRYAFMYDTANWHSLLGFDYWRQAKEDLRGFADNKPCDKFDIRKALRPEAQQAQIFISLGYYSRSQHRKFTWHSIITGSATVFHKGIGSEYNIGIRVGIEF